MIELSVSDFFGLVLLLSTSWIAYLALRLQYRSSSREWHLSSRQLFECDNCHLSFVPDEPVTICRCPRCNAYCIKRSRRRR